MSKLQRFHWIAGSDDFRRRECLRQLLAAEIPEGTEAFNYDRIGGRESTAERVLSIVRTPPMMAERRVLHIDGADLMPKDAIEALIAGVEEAIKRQDAGADDLAVVLSLDVGRNFLPATQYVSRKLKALAGQLHEIDAFHEERDWSQARAWCRNYADKALGLELEPRAAEALTDAIGITDTGRLAGELEKLSILAKGEPVGADLVRQVVGVTHGRSLKDLCDRIGERDLHAALEVLPEVLGSPDHNGIRISVNVGYRLAKLALARSLAEEGTPPGSIRSQVGYQAGQIISQSEHWSVAELDVALDALLEADLQLKSGGEDQECLEYFLHRALPRTHAAPTAAPTLPVRP